MKRGIIIFALASMISGCSMAKAEVGEVQTTSQIQTTVTNVQENMSVQALTAKAPKVTTTAAPTFTDVDEEGYVTGNNVNVRSLASKTSDVVTKLSAGKKVHVIGRNSDWLKIEVDGKKVFIAAQYVSNKAPETTAAPTTAASTASSNVDSSGSISLDPSWKYADFSKIKSGSAKLYKAENNRKGITICVNAGHGTKGGSSVKTLCHPDGTPKVTGGTTSAGATQAVAVSSGTTLLDGTSEAAVTLKMAKAFKNELLARGYDVVMIRESDDVQLDNIARTVIANNTSNAHIALHWDSTTSDKGAFYMKVPNVASYKAMEPVASNWKKHDALGESLVAGLRGAGVRIFSGGSMEMDLTQTSYSTVPSIDIELGDRNSDHSDATIATLAKGLADGVGAYFGQ